MKHPNAKILIADDEKAITSGLGAILGDEGYEVSTAPTGEEGLSLSRSSAPDVILLDLTA